MATKFAFYTTTTGSSLDSASISSGSIQTYHLSASSVTPAKANLTQAWDFTGGSISVPTPGTSAGATPKSYVLSAISESLGGGTVADAATGAVRGVVVGSDLIVAMFTYDSGAKTLTFLSNTNLNNFGIGGYSDLAVNDRLLFTVPATAACFAASGSWSGIYTITDVGADDPGGSPPVLTRATDFDSLADVIPGSFVLATSEQDNFGIWFLKTSGSITFDTTPLLFVTASFSGSGGTGTTYTAQSPVEISGSIIKIQSASIGPAHLSNSLVQSNSGLLFDNNNGFSVVASGALSVGAGGIYINANSILPGHLNSAVVGNGLILASDLAVNRDITDSQNPITVTSDGIAVRKASSLQSGYISASNFAELESVVSYSYIPATIGSITTPVTTSSSETKSFLVGTVPANAIWNVKFTSFSVDTANPVNQATSMGACTFYRSGSANVVQVGNTEVEHTFASGAFTFVTMSMEVAQGAAGNVHIAMHGIDPYNIKHWVKFQAVEFVYA
jgi:hypothetical protein